MSVKRTVISGTGCALADYLYTDVDFNSPVFRKYLSKKAGDGGLSPGKLVFTGELEEFSGIHYSKLLADITTNRLPDSFNIGGPGLVSFIHASQILDNELYDVKFYGSMGGDDTATRILDLVKTTPLNIDSYKSSGNKPTPFTDVLSDPSYADGHGERTFINNIGSAWDYSVDNIMDEFFNSQIVCFGGTALVPHIHDNLTLLLKRAKERNAITVVNTVFDFRNEKKEPFKPWPLVESDDNFNLVDVLIMDREEALKISGQNDDKGAGEYFIRNGVSSFFITNGANDIMIYSDGRLFSRMGIKNYPVSQLVTPALRSKGDTTGCGDNFAGGIIADLAMETRSGTVKPDILSALSWAVASGGFACTYVGGTFFESYRGEKLQKIIKFRNGYLKQIGCNL
jgi:sugar/nucleoside kinase (ribokinase family)